MTQSNFGGSSAPTLAANTTVVTPFDRVRWGPIWAGLFTALSTIAVLGVLGLAIGASAYDRNDSARAFGIGAGIWGVLSYLIAFALGGWIAARSAVTAGSRNGLLNGSMVWAVAIPLMLFMLGGGLAAAVGAASNAASNVASNPDVTSRATDGAGGGSGGGIMDQAQTASNRISANMSGGQDANATAEDVRRTSAKTAWWTLLSLILGLGAAAMGGYLGSHEPGQRRFSSTHSTSGDGGNQNH